MRALVLMAILAVACEPAPIDVLKPIENPGGIDTQPSRCSIAGAPLCEGFEGKLLGYPPWGLVGFSGVASIDSSRHYLGSQSLRVHLEADPGGPDGKTRQGEVTEDTAVPGPAQYVRAYLYLPSPGPPSFLRFVTAYQRDPPYPGIALWVDQGMVAYSGLDSDFTKHLSTTPMPLDQWVCVEWSIVADTAAGSSQVWLDGTEIVDLRVTGATQSPAGLGRIAFGGAIFGATNRLDPYDFWMDELIVDTRRRSCDD